jgi:hypothetical protein
MQENDVVLIKSINSDYNNYYGQIKLKGRDSFNVKIFNRKNIYGFYEDNVYKVFKEYDLIKISKEHK